jgi:hypothetical protein
MTEFAYEEGRWEPPIAGDEDATLLGFLERQRATFAWKSGDRSAGHARPLNDDPGRDAEAPHPL